MREFSPTLSAGELAGLVAGQQGRTLRKRHHVGFIMTKELEAPGQPQNHASGPRFVIPERKIPGSAHPVVMISAGENQEVPEQKKADTVARTFIPIIAQTDRTADQSGDDLAGRTAQDSTVDPLTRVGTPPDRPGGHHPEVRGEEPNPRRRLSATEQYQLFGRHGRSTITQERMTQLRDEIVGDSSLQQTILANPYSQAADEVIRERFQGIHPADVRRAAILGEPAGIYEMGVLSQDSMRNAQTGTDEFFKRAAVISRLLIYMRKMYINTDRFNDMPAEAQYAEFVKAAFGTTNQEVLETTCAQDLRRQVKLSAINAIEDFAYFNTVIDKIRESEEQATEVVQSALNIRLTAESTVTVLTNGLIIYLNGYDYQNIALSLGDTFIVDAIDNPAYKPLEGKIVAVNIGDSEPTDPEVRALMQPETERATRQILYNSFIRSTEPYNALTSVPPPDLAGTRGYANELVEQFFEEAKIRLITDFPFSPGRLSHTFDEVGATHFSRIMDQQFARIWDLPGVSPTEKQAMYQTYETAYRRYLSQTSKFIWAVETLSQSFNERRSSLSAAQRVAYTQRYITLLSIISPGSLRRLGRELDIPDEIVGVYSPDEMVGFEYNMERVALAHEFSTSVTTANENYHYEGGEDERFDEKKSFWEHTVQIPLTKLERHPIPEALPEVRTLLRGTNSEVLLDSAVNTIDYILRLHHEEMSPRELRFTRAALIDFYHKNIPSMDPLLPTVRAKARALIETIDDIYLPPSGPDFVNKPVTIAVRDLRKEHGIKPLDANYINQLREILAGQDEYIWNKYYVVTDYTPLLSNEEGIDALIAVATSAPNATIPLEILEQLSFDIPLFSEAERQKIGQACGIVLQLHIDDINEGAEELRRKTIEIQNELQMGN